MAAPTLVSYNEVAYNDFTTPRSTASISWNAGDLLVAVAGLSDGSGTLNTPTGTGLTFASVFAGQAGTDSSHCGGNIWTASPGSGGSSAVQGGWTTGSFLHWGMSVWVWRDHGGEGADNSAASTPLTLSLTRSGANSCVVGGVFDWNATATTGYGFTPTVANDRVHLQDSGNFTSYVADWGDQGGAGSTSYGITGITGGPFTIVLAEILASGPATPQPTIVQAAQAFTPF